MTFFSAEGKKERRSKADFAPTWRSRRDSNPRAVLAATRFPVVLVMTTSILLHMELYTATEYDSPVMIHENSRLVNIK